MSHKSAAPKTPAERAMRDIRRATRKHYSAEDKIRIVLESLRGEESIAACVGGKASPGASTTHGLSDRLRMVVLGWHG